MFADRVRNQLDFSKAASKLAHVLVHEITRILQGTDYHAESGIMKARWDEDDYSLMFSKHLRFTPLDIELIQRGLSGWASRAAALRGLSTTTS